MPPGGSARGWGWAESGEAGQSWSLRGVWGPMPRSWPAERYRAEVGTSDYALLARLAVEQRNGARPVFLFCGQTAITNEAATRGAPRMRRHPRRPSSPRFFARPRRPSAQPR
jgi:hypothetical protein